MLCTSYYGCYIWLLVNYDISGASVSTDGRTVMGTDGLINSGQPTSSSMPAVSYERDIKAKCVETEVPISCYQEVSVELLVTYL